MQPPSNLFRILAALFIGLPLLDLLVVVALGNAIGFWPTVGMIIISGFLGAGLAKSQGLKVWWGIQRDLNEFRVPSQGILDAVLILISGGMLMAPGFITDILGLALLVPAVRVPIKSFLRHRIERAMVNSHRL